MRVQLITPGVPLNDLPPTESLSFSSFHLPTPSTLFSHFLVLIPILASTQLLLLSGVTPRQVIPDLCALKTEAGPRPASPSAGADSGMSPQEAERCEPTVIVSHTLTGSPPTSTADASYSWIKRDRVGVTFFSKSGLCLLKKE